MAGFGDLFNAITGQKELAPYSELTLQDAMGKAVPLAANSNIQYNDILQPALARQGLASSNQVNPYANQLEQATTKSILDQLNLGGELPDEIKQQVQRSALGSGISSGLGISPAGRGLVARDLGLTGLDLLNQRIGRAQQFSPIASQSAARFFMPQMPFNPSNVTNQLEQQNQAEQERAAEAFYNDKSNFINMLNTGGRVLGGVAGGIFGGPMGAQMGMNIGGSLISNPYAGNSGSGGGGGGGFSSLLNSAGGQNLLSGLFGGGKGGGGATMAGPDSFGSGGFGFA